MAKDFLPVQRSGNTLSAEFRCAFMKRAQFFNPDFSCFSVPNIPKVPEEMLFVFGMEHIQRGLIHIRNFYRGNQLLKRSRVRIQVIPHIIYPRFPEFIHPNLCFRKIFFPQGNGRLVK